jgi:aminoglycoside phosphotransferase (APT) family kinase protein
MSAPHSEAIRHRLVRYLESKLGAGCTVEDFEPMTDGHAGLTFGFTVCGEPDASPRRYILKVGPPGVTRRGSTDVYRQAVPLRALRAAGLLVPAVPWAESEETVLGVPFLVMERLRGRTFVMWEPHTSFATDAVAVRPLWLDAAVALAGIHSFDWQEPLQNWEPPAALTTELERWGSLLRHASETSWLASGQRLARRLASDVPRDPLTALVHGDFHPGNVLYEGGRLNGIIDWDLVGIGAIGTDVGWLLMMSDPSAWSDTWQPISHVSRHELLSAYRAAGGPVIADLHWFQAFSQFRMGAIACLNVKLHRNGRRPDPLWDRFASSIPTLFAYGEDLLADREPRSPA